MILILAKARKDYKFHPVLQTKWHSTLLIFDRFALVVNLRVPATRCVRFPPSSHTCSHETYSVTSWGSSCMTWHDSPSIYADSRQFEARACPKMHYCVSAIRFHGKKQPLSDPFPRVLIGSATRFPTPRGRSGRTVESLTAQRPHHKLVLNPHWT
jgi:hypothetical protein